jgi:hypothetical protein
LNLMKLSKPSQEINCFQWTPKQNIFQVKKSANSILSFYNTSQINTLYPSTLCNRKKACTCMCGHNLVRVRLAFLGKLRLPCYKWRASGFSFSSVCQTGLIGFQGRKILLNCLAVCWSKEHLDQLRLQKYHLESW